MKIGVFDSGVGGKSVANAVQAALPEHAVLYFEDRKNIPYGTKTPKQLSTLVNPILETMVNEGCDVIVIACNTVTTTIIEQLRNNITIPLIGVEPMLKPASQQTKSNIIAVCATPTTLASQRYQELVTTHAQHLEILEPDCSEWAYMIEHDDIDHQRIRQQVTLLCKQGADVIVLGCTHYHWIEEDIKDVAALYTAAVIQPEQAVIRQLMRVIARLG